MSRVYGPYKLRAAAANTRWRSAEDAYNADPSPESAVALEQTHARVKVYTREWYHFAIEAGMGVTTPLQLCIHAAGGFEYCER